MTKCADIETIEIEHGFVQGYGKTREAARKELEKNLRVHCEKTRQTRDKPCHPGTECEDGKSCMDRALIELEGVTTTELKEEEPDSDRRWIAEYSGVLDCKCHCAKK
jgi:hypothetical protein